VGKGTKSKAGLLYQRLFLLVIVELQGCTQEQELEMVMKSTGSDYLQITKTELKWILGVV
jgi:hypothetical protein